MPERADAELLRAFLRGDEAALGELAGRYERGLLGMALGLLSRDREAAKDAVQETWVRVIRYGKTFKGESSFKTWLYRVLINVCADERVKRSHHRASTAVPRAAHDSASDDEDALHLAVEQLGHDKRVVVLLCYHRGMTHSQAAEALGLPIGTLKSRLHTALEELRRVLPEEVGCG